MLDSMEVYVLDSIEVYVLDSKSSMQYFLAKPPLSLANVGTHELQFALGQQKLTC